MRRVRPSVRPSLFPVSHPSSRFVYLVRIILLPLLVVELSIERLDETRVFEVDECISDVAVVL